MTRLVRTLLVLIFLAHLTACSAEKASSTAPTDYRGRLAAAKGEAPFKHWPFYARPFVNRIFDRLVSDLVTVGEGANEEKKIGCFRRAVSALNSLDATMPFLIETTEAEDLVGSGNQIAKAAGLDPKKYGDSEGPLSAGRNW